MGWKLLVENLNKLKEQKEDLIKKHDEVLFFRKIAHVMAAYIRDHNKGTLRSKKVIDDLRKIQDEFEYSTPIIEYVLRDFLINNHDEESMYILRLPDLGESTGQGLDA